MRVNERVLLEAVLNEGILDKVKGAIETIKYQASQKVGVKKTQKYQDAVSLLNKELDKDVNFLLKNTIAKASPDFPNQKSKEDFSQTLDALYTYYVSIRDDYSLSVEVTNAMIDSLKKYVAKVRDNELTAVYQHVNEGIDEAIGSEGLTQLLQKATDIKLGASEGVENLKNAITKLGGGDYTKGLDSVKDLFKGNGGGEPDKQVNALKSLIDKGIKSGEHIGDLFSKVKATLGTGQSANKIFSIQGSKTLDSLPSIDKISAQTKGVGSAIGKSVSSSDIAQNIATNILNPLGITLAVGAALYGLAKAKKHLSSRYAELNSLYKQLEPVYGEESQESPENTGDEPTNDKEQDKPSVNVTKPEPEKPGEDASTNNVSVTLPKGVEPKKSSVNVTKPSNDKSGKDVSTNNVSVTLPKGAEPKKPSISATKPADKKEPDEDASTDKVSVTMPSGEKAPKFDKNTDTITKRGVSVAKPAQDRKIVTVGADKPEDTKKGKEKKPIVAVPFKTSIYKDKPEVVKLAVDPTAKEGRTYKPVIFGLSQSVANVQKSETKNDQKDKLDSYLLKIANKLANSKSKLTVDLSDRDLAGIKDVSTIRTIKPNTEYMKEGLRLTFVESESNSYSKLKTSGLKEGEKEIGPELGVRKFKFKPTNEKLPGINYEVRYKKGKEEAFDDRVYKDGENLIFLGQYKNHDLYIVKYSDSRVNLIAISSDEPGNYASGMSFINKMPQITEAAKRAIKLGIIDIPEYAESLKEGVFSSDPLGDLKGKDVSFTTKSAEGLNSVTTKAISSEIKDGNWYIKLQDNQTLVIPKKGLAKKGLLIKANRSHEQVADLLGGLDKVAKNVIQEVQLRESGDIPVEVGKMLLTLLAIVGPIGITAGVFMDNYKSATPQDRKKMLQNLINKKEIKEVQLRESIKTMLRKSLQEDIKKELNLTDLERMMQGYPWYWQDSKDDYQRNNASETDRKVRNLVTKFGKEGEDIYNDYAPTEELKWGKDIKEEEVINNQKIKDTKEMSSVDLAKEVLAKKFHPESVNNCIAYIKIYNEKDKTPDMEDALEILDKLPIVTKFKQKHNINEGYSFSKIDLQKLTPGTPEFGKAKKELIKKLKAAAQKASSKIIASTFDQNKRNKGVAEVNKLLSDKIKEVENIK